MLGIKMNKTLQKYYMRLMGLAKRCYALDDMQVRRASYILRRDKETVFL